jgi:hypothetical protein
MIGVPERVPQSCALLELKRRITFIAWASIFRDCLLTHPALHAPAALPSQAQAAPNGALRLLKAHTMKYSLLHNVEPLHK